MGHLRWREWRLETHSRFCWPTCPSCTLSVACGPAVSALANFADISRNVLRLKMVRPRRHAPMKSQSITAVRAHNFGFIWTSICKLLIMNRAVELTESCLLNHRIIEWIIPLHQRLVHWHFFFIIFVKMCTILFSWQNMWHSQNVDSAKTILTGVD